MTRGLLIALINGIMARIAATVPSSIQVSPRAARAGIDPLGPPAPARDAKNVFVRGSELYQIGLDALAACSAAIRTGATFGDVFAAYIGTLARAGLGGMTNRLNACGYSLGTTFSPNWMDWPMVYRDNPAVIEPGMVIFLHMVVTDGPRNVAPGETFLSTATGAERLGKMPLSLDPEPFAVSSRGVSGPAA